MRLTFRGSGAVESASALARSARWNQLCQLVEDALSSPSLLPGDEEPEPEGWAWAALRAQALPSGAARGSAEQYPPAVRLLLDAADPDDLWTGPEWIRRNYLLGVSDAESVASLARGRRLLQTRGPDYVPPQNLQRYWVVLAGGSRSNRPVGPCVVRDLESYYALVQDQHAPRGTFRPNTVSRRLHGLPALTAYLWGAGRPELLRHDFV